MTTTTPNMNLVLPDVSITAGPQWATLLNAAYALIDSHDHATGHGVKITPSGMNISSDLSFAQNNATNLRTLRMFNNSSISLGVNDKTCLYSLNNELYYVDGAGNNIQMTLNGVIDLSGTISALTIKDSGFTMQYFGDVTRQMRFNLAAIPTSTVRVMSVPDSGANDTFVTQAAAQVLTNKTLTAPIIAAINTGSVSFTLPAADGTGGQILQTNGSAVLSFVNPPAAAPANIAANDSNVTFTSSDNQYQVCTPTAPRTYTMPATLTAGSPWTFYNQATSWANVITIQSSGSNTITTVPPQGYVVILPLTSTPTTAANWKLTHRESSDVAYTPSFTGFGTVTAAAGMARVIGNVLYGRVSGTSGTTTAVLAQVTIPTTVAISTAGLTKNNNSSNTGDVVGVFGQAAPSVFYLLTAPASSTTSLYCGTYYSAGTGSTVLPTIATTMVAINSDFSGNYEVSIV